MMGPGRPASLAALNPWDLEHGPGQTVYRKTIDLSCSSKSSSCDRRKDLDVEIVSNTNERLSIGPPNKYVKNLPFFS